MQQEKDEEKKKSSKRIAILDEKRWVEKAGMIENGGARERERWQVEKVKL